MHRFARHHALAGLGAEGQARIAHASVLVVGVGGLGCPVAQYLAAAGIGRLRLCDPGVVDAPDLHRQVLFGSGDEGRGKAEAAAERLTGAYPDVDVEHLARTFDASMADGPDVVVDGTDEAGTRAYVHRSCLASRVPLVWGALEAWEAQLTTIAPGGPCLRCLWPAPGEAPACEDIGVFGPLAGMVGTIMASEALRAVLGLPVLSGRLLLVDGRTTRFSEVAYARRSGCACSAATK